MSKMKKSGRPSTLLALYDNALLRSKIDTAIDTHTSYEQIVSIAAAYGFKVSRATISRYSSLRKESIDSGTPLRELLDGNAKKTLNAIKAKEVNNFVTPPAELNENDVPIVNVTHRVSDMEYLDLLISKGFDTLVNLDAPVSNKDVTAAIALKAKMTNNANAGLNAEGLKTLRVEMANHEQALRKALMAYVPEDKQDEAAKAIDDAEQEWKKNMESTPSGKAILDALKTTGVRL